MRLIPGTAVTVLLNRNERHFTLVIAGGDGDRRLNVVAPLAVLLGAMSPGDVVKAWTPLTPEAEAMRVELMTVEAAS